MSRNGAPRPPEDARRVLSRLQRDIAKLGVLVDAAEDEPGADWSFNDLAVIFAALDRAGDHFPGLTQQLAAVRDQVRHRAAHAYPRSETQVTLSGVGVLELCRAGKTTRWEGPRLAHHLAARVADEGVDRESGETLPLGVLCERVADVIVDAAGLDAASKAWRKTSVERYGLDPGEFSESSGGTLSVRFVD